MQHIHKKTKLIAWHDIDSFINILLLKASDDYIKCQAA